MTELKTLKDLFKSQFGHSKIIGVDVEELKAEAIKWRKKKWHLTVDDWDEFFNITEEDLK